ncbi:unnamed protein product [Allacma fusca]|uniref:Uncharacterized protein n=1 Tax=Allacma fusca TaxID=39272 RepID=A0A8J2J112_9HEXA|nr:unnamed protein product [Allacma fusca]
MHQCQTPGERKGYVDAGAHLDLTDFYEYSRSYGGSMISYKYKHNLSTPDIETTFSEVEPATAKLLKELFDVHLISKVEISIGVQMEKEVVEESGDKGYKQALIYFKSAHHELQTSASITSILLQSASDIIEKKNTFVENGSGWTVQRIESFEIKLGEIRLFSNSSASGHLETPFKNRQGYLNFRNRDNNCFKYCISAGLYWDEQTAENMKTGASNRNLACHRTWKNVDPNEERALGGNTTIDKKFEPASYVFIIVKSSENGQEILAQEYYDGDNPVEHFFQNVFKYAQDILWSIRTTNNFVVPTEEERKQHEDAANSVSANSPRQFQRRILLTTRKKEVLKMTIYSNNGINHLLSKPSKGRPPIRNSVGEASSIFDAKDISVISKGTEKFVQLEIPAREMKVPSLNYFYNTGHYEKKRWTGNRKVKLRFIDSCQVSPSKLSSLAEALKKENAKTLNLVNEIIPYILGHTNEIAAKRTKDEIDGAAELIFEKLPYPYRYLSSAEVLKDGHPIPGQCFFNNDLRNEPCTDEDWHIVQNVIKAFNINDFRQFTRLYTLVDVILLAVIWENFRKNGLEMYGLDPTYMCTGSGYSFQCFLFKTKAEVDYMRDPKMISWLSRGIRGGTAFCSKKIETANNEQCPNGFNPA